MPSGFGDGRETCEADCLTVAGVTVRIKSEKP